MGLKGSSSESSRSSWTRVEIRPKWDWKNSLKTSLSPSFLFSLKSDQSGIESDVIFQPPADPLRQLKSDQSGIERHLHWRNWFYGGALKSDQSGIESKIRNKEYALVIFVEIRPKWDWKLYVRPVGLSTCDWLKSDQSGIERCTLLRCRTSSCGHRWLKSDQSGIERSWSWNMLSLGAWLKSDQSGIESFTTPMIFLILSPCWNQTKVGLKAQELQEVKHALPSGWNQTKVGLKEMTLPAPSTTIPSVEIRPKWDWKWPFWSAWIPPSAGWNQTKVGLKVSRVLPISPVLWTLKSDQSGIESPFPNLHRTALCIPQVEIRPKWDWKLLCKGVLVHFQIQLKSDQSGIESSASASVALGSCQLKSDQSGIERDTEGQDSSRWRKLKSDQSGIESPLSPSSSTNLFSRWNQTKVGLKGQFH